MEPSPELIQKIAAIQGRVVVKKTRYNSHGGYHYRDLEDILTALAPELRAEGLFMYMSDEVIEVAGTAHLVAHVTVTDGTSKITVDGWAQEAKEQKGMAPAQITGACSSYARKYALNGLFLLDDVDDDGIGAQPQEPPSKGGFNARCQTCGKGYRFESKEQYAGFITNIQQHPCCNQPNWKVV